MEQFSGTRTSASEVAQLLGERMAELVLHLIGKPDDIGRGGTEWRYGRRGSLAVMVGGTKQGSWFDNEAGSGGDALSMVHRQNGGSLGEALKWAIAWLGLETGAPRPASPPRKGPEPVADGDSLDLVMRLWREAVDIQETPAERYLTSRGLRVPEGVDCLRFHPRCPRGSGAEKEYLAAMVALMRNVETDEPQALHRTFLMTDGSGKIDHGKDRMMIGHAGGAAVKLSPNDEITFGLSIGEGIETCMSVMNRGWRPMWAAASAGNIGTFPVLPGVSALTIWADNDAKGTGQKVALECASRWLDAGREATVFVAPAGFKDFNDVIKGAA